MVEDVRHVFDAPTDPRVGRIINDECRRVRHDLFGIGERLEPLGDTVQNISLRHHLVVF